jgi:hypothetical protein
MKIQKLTIAGMVLAMLLSVGGCSSNLDSDDDLTVGSTPDEIKAAASFVGSTKCLSCHGDKSNWGHTLHKLTLRAPGDFSSAQAKAEAFYGETINNGLLLSLGGDDGKNDPGTPDGEFVAYYSDGDSWKTHYELGAGATASIIDLPPLIDLVYEPKFAAKIIVEGGVYFVEFVNLVAAETARYKILFSYGGERNYKQRYVLVADSGNQGAPLGASKHISPLQYNDRWSGYVDPTSPTTPDLNYKWVNYHPERWYDLDDDALVTPGSKDSFDGNCAGCHFTGYRLTKNGGGEETADAADDINGAVDFDGDGTMDEINIGCEACHGAGSDHAATQNPAYITNPANLNPSEANMVCGQCHVRGKSVDSFTEFAEASATAPVQAPFPAKLNENGELMKFRPGLDDLTEFYSFDSGVGTFDSQYWGGEPSGGNFQASRQHHQQYIDMLQGPHAPDQDFDPRCFDCHELHNNASPGRHQVVTSITDDNVVVKTANDDNSLCLACHAGHGPFAAVTVEDVARINSNSAFNLLMEPVKTAVTDHTQHYYDPANQDGSNGSSRCSRCHMPKTAKTALNYDIHSHTFEVIEPAASKTTSLSPGVPNGCTSCHAAADDIALDDLQAAFDAKFPKGGDGTLDATLRAADLEFSQWAGSGHADYAGDPFNRWNEDGSVSASCAKCHSKDGFIDFAADGTVDAAAKLGTTLSCGACHTNGDSSMLYTDPSTRYATQVANIDILVDPEPLESVVFPSGLTANLGDASNMCMACHQGRESKNSVDAATPATDGTFRFTNIHYYAAAASFFGTDVQGGYEYEAATSSFAVDPVYAGRNLFPAHPATLQTCIGCHLQEGAANHTFIPDVARCIECHGGTTVETLGGSPSQNLADILALKDQVHTLLTGSGVNALGNYPYFSNITTIEQLKAAYNWQVANAEPCGYIHNGTYIKQLLYDSIVDLSTALGAPATPVVTRP